jgi:hypothetical protein
MIFVQNIQSNPTKVWKKKPNRVIFKKEKEERILLKLKD